MNQERDYVFMVRYTTWMKADFGPEPIVTVAGPFKDEQTAEYWIDNNPDEYHENLFGYPNPTVQKHPVRELSDLK